MSEVECPTCDGVYTNERGMKIHHARTHGESIANKVEKECRVCNTEFVDYVDSGHGESYYCSRDCMSEDYSDRASRNEFGFGSHGYKTPKGQDNNSWIERETIECMVCGETIEVKITDGRKVCGIECVWKLNGSRKFRTFRYQKCHSPECDKVFTVSPKGKDKKTCSEECGHTLRTHTKVENGTLYPSRKYDDVLKHIVRSDWEREIGKLLKRNSVTYDYEPFMISKNGLRYVPDFKVGNTIIEVKGRGSNNDVEKAKMCMQQRDEKYIVVGRELPADHHITWDNKEEVLDYV